MLFNRKEPQKRHAASELKVSLQMLSSNSLPKEMGKPKPRPNHELWEEPGIESRLLDSHLPRKFFLQFLPLQRAAPRNDDDGSKVQSR